MNDYFSGGGGGGGGGESASSQATASNVFGASGISENVVMIIGLGLFALVAIGLLVTGRTN